MKKTDNIVIGKALIPALNRHTAKAMFVAFGYVPVGYWGYMKIPGTYRGEGIVAEGTLYRRSGHVGTAENVSLFMVVFSGN